MFSILLSFSACEKNQSSEVSKNHQTSTKIIEQEWQQEIKLNNGKTWEANRETTEGILLMKNRISRDQSEALEGYHQLAADLKNNLDHFIKKCTMKGAAHDNLHVYLHPLIEKIHKLSEISSEKEAPKLKSNISDHINLYSSYFR